MGIIINMVNFDIDMGKIHFSLTSMIVKKKQIQGGGGTNTSPGGVEYF